MSQYTSSFLDKDAPADIAVVGLGPGGLAAALEAAESGKQVVAFSNRGEYIRGQRLFLAPSTIEFFKKYTDLSDPEDTKFWDKYEKEGTIQIKDIEKFLYRKLKQYSNAQIIQLKEPDKIQAVADAEDASSTVIELSNGQKFYTKNILASDGARHDFANLMNRDLKADIQYTTSPVQERHRYHGIVQLMLKYEECYLFHSSHDPNSFTKEELTTLFKNKDGCILYNTVPFYFDHETGNVTVLEPDNEELANMLTALDPDEARLAAFKEHVLINNATNRFLPANPVSVNPVNIARRALHFMKQGWNELFEPNYYVFSNADSTKFYFAGEIPQTIFDEPDDVIRGERLKEWASYAIQSLYGYNEEQLHYRQSVSTPAKDRLQATVFKMEMQVCQQPLVSLCSGVFAQIGDARRTSNYNLGHGLNDAIAGGIAFVNAMDSGNSSFKHDEFVPFMQKMDKDVEWAMTKKIMPQQKKLLAVVDKLIDYLEKVSIIDDDNLMALKWGRHEIANTNGLNKIQEVLDNIKPIIEQYPHQDTGFGYLAWRWVAAIFSENAARTKPANLLAEVSTALNERLSSRPNYRN